MGLTRSRGISLAAAGFRPPPWQQVANIVGADLLAQWDVTNAPSVALSGTVVTGWTDLVGGVVLAPGAVGTRPAYSEAGFNSKGPAVTFDGSNDFLSVDQVPWLSGAAPGEVWVCMRQDTPAAIADRVIFSIGSNSTVNASRMLWRAPVGGINRGYVSTGTGAAAAFATNVTTDFSGYHVARVTWSATAMGLSFDGGAAATAAGVPATATQRTVLGATYTTAGSFCAMAVSALIITNPLSAEKAAGLLAQLQSRF
jgi:hypothetical protein